MDEKEYLRKPMGIPLDPEKQKDPDDAGEHVPAEGRADFLNDVTEQNGGQRSEVGVPYNDRSLERGMSDEYDKHGGRGVPKCKETKDK
jgi:hypothetical protein